MLKKYAYIQVLAVAIFICLSSMSFAAQNNERLKGTWENPQYIEGVWKLIFHADGSYDAFSKLEASKGAIKGECKIVEKWTDSNGCFCYKTIFWSDKGQKSYCLMKISASGKILEYVEDFMEYPKLFNSEVYTYRKLYKN